MNSFHFPNESAERNGAPDFQIFVNTFSSKKTSFYQNVKTAVILLIAVHDRLLVMAVKLMTVGHTL